ncbi:MAG UNVERIFIED_CONTAM: hypothetical protein LVR18_31825 [Planctomycetaceae bacterium]
MLIVCTLPDIDAHSPLKHTHQSAARVRHSILIRLLYRINSGRICRHSPHTRGKSSDPLPLQPHSAAGNSRTNRSNCSNHRNRSENKDSPSHSATV